MKQFAAVFILCSTFMFISAQSPKEKGFEAITEEAVEAQLEFLASDWTEGRATATKGAYMAADYIASMFKVYGIKPAGDMVQQYFSRREIDQGKKAKTYRSYFQNFPLLEYKANENQVLSISSVKKNSKSIIHLDYKTDFSVNPGPVSMEGFSDIVFVGYGFKNEEKEYNDFEKVDVEGKIILRISGFPGHKDKSSTSYNDFKPADRRARWYMDRDKNTAAQEEGAIAILEINMDSDFTSLADNVPFRFNTPLYEGDRRQESFYDYRLTFPGDSLKQSPPVFYISARMANEILSGSEISLPEFEKRLADDPTPKSKLLKGKSAHFKTSVDSRIVKARNVVGVIEGQNKDEIIVVGGHYDHLGIHDGYIWNGADDNASGTVGVMTLAKACMATGEKPEKTIVFAAWTGEEKGLWGSKYFADNPYDGKEIILNLNYDMISRDDKDDEEGVKCRMSYTKAFKQMEVISEDNIEAFDLDLEVNYRPSETASGGSDHAPFAKKDIPYFYFMAGFPPEYHQPDDHIELINITKMTNIIRLGFLNIWDFSNSDNWKK
jgi:hypothetical protein